MAPADGTDGLLLPSLTPAAAVTDGLSASAADLQGLDKPATARVFGWPELARPADWPTVAGGSHKRLT